MTTFREHQFTALTLAGALEYPSERLLLALIAAFPYDEEFGFPDDPETISRLIGYVPPIVGYAIDGLIARGMIVRGDYIDPDTGEIVKTLRLAGDALATINAAHAAMMDTIRAPTV